jgi:hypothetical protein
MTTMPASADAVSNFPSCHGISYGSDAADDLVPGAEWEPAAHDVILGEYIGKAHAACLDFDKNFASSGESQRCLLDYQGFARSREDGMFVCSWKRHSIIERDRYYSFQGNLNNLKDISSVVHMKSKEKFAQRELWVSKYLTVGHAPSM